MDNNEIEMQYEKDARIEWIMDNSGDFTFEALQALTLIQLTEIADSLSEE